MVESLPLAQSIEEIQRAITSNIEKCEQHKANLEELKKQLEEDDRMYYQDAFGMSEEEKKAREHEKEAIQRAFQRVQSLEEECKEHQEQEGRERDMDLEAEVQHVKVVREAIETTSIAAAKIEATEAVRDSTVLDVTISAEEQKNIDAAEVAIFYEQKRQLENKCKDLKDKQKSYIREFQEKAEQRLAGAIDKKEKIESLELNISMLIDAEENDQALQEVKNNLDNDEVDEEKLLTGKEEDYMTNGTIDKDKTRKRFDLSIKACEMRIKQMDFVTTPGWKETLEEMLEAPFFEIQQKLWQYCAGELNIRNHYEKLQVTVNRLEERQKSILEKLGNIDRLGLAGRKEDEIVVRQRITDQIIDLQRYVSGDNWDAQALEARDNRAAQ